MRHSIVLILAFSTSLLLASNASAQREVRDQGISSNFSPLTWFNPSPPVRGLWRLPGISTDYKLGPGDELEIFITDYSDTSVSVTVSNVGEVAIPLIGRIAASGLTTQQLEEQIATRLKGRQLLETPEVLVNVAEYQAKPIYIFGEVDNQGQYIMTQELTLMEFVLMAGGLDFGAGRYGYLHRHASSGLAPETPGESVLRHPDRPQPGWTVERVDIQPLKEGGVLSPDIPLRAGDVFVVPRSTAGVFYVIGDVNRPGVFEIPAERTMRVSQALASTGGPTRTAKVSKGVLIRYDERGTRQELPVDFTAILRGRETDFTVQPEDVIFIPGAAAKTLGLGLLNVVPTVLVAPLMF